MRPIHITPPMLEIEQLTVRFGATMAVDAVSLEVRRGEIVCLLGPSGSGKSALLRAVAGVERQTSGRILIDGAEVAGPSSFVEPEQRRVGMVFQDYALFPHLNVEANVAFGLRRGDRSAAPLIERLGLRPLARSYPHELSGGERQRVALARAMAPNPSLLLMDEPFSSLDSRLRDDVRRHTLDLVRDSGTTTVIVTHDPDEAMRIADRIALLDRGRLVQCDTPESLYRRPATLFAARFFSDVAALPGTCGGGFVETRLGRFAAPGLAQDEPAFACLRPRQLKLVAGADGVEGRVVGTEYLGDCSHVLVAVRGIEEPVAVCVEPEDEVRAVAEPGSVVHLAVRSPDVPVVTGKGAIQ
ncbi:MAG TPA: ABC transporter ATP-binding protein [Gammaproteobacteria bacterium]|nr:ABC transporter ATP-binding protein [Gammaproteobacteria bacterium]